MPELLALGEADGGLGRGAIVVPVFFILGADFIEVEGEGRVPVAEADGVGDAGVLGRHLTVAEHFAGLDGVEGEGIGCGEEPAFLLPEIVVERDGIADVDLQLGGGPIVDDDGAFGDVLAGGDKGVGDAGAGRANGVGHVHQEYFGAEVVLLRGGEGALDLIIAEEAGGAFKLNAAAGGGAGDAEADVFQAKVSEEGQIAAELVGEEEHVGAGVEREFLLQGAELDEGGADGALTRLESEAADAVIREGGAIAEAGGADRLFLAGVERFLGDFAGFFDAEEDAFAVLGVELGGEGLAENDVAIGGERVGVFVQIPEAIVDAVDEYAAGGTVGALVLNDGFEEEDWGGGGADTLGEGFGEGLGGDDGGAGVAEAAGGDAAQTFADRFADEGRAGEGGGGNGEAGHYRDIRPPVVPQAALRQISPCHGLGRAFQVASAHGELPGEFGGDGGAVGDDHEDAAHLLLQFGEERENLPGGCFIEVAGGLVAEQQFGLADEGAGDGDALLFAAGELGGEVIDARGEAGAFDEVFRAVDDGVVAVADEGGREDVFKDGALREERVVLEYEADAGIAEAGLFGLFELPGLDAVEGELAGGGRVEQAEDLQ